MKKLAKILAGVVVMSVSVIASAQNYPNKVVKIIVPYPAGGTVDAVARAVAQRLTVTMGQTFIVDNRPGANGTLGSNIAAKSPPDGYTLLVQASTFVATPLLMSGLPYNLEKDFTPITQLGSVPLLVTSYPGIPVKNLKEFMALIRAEPGKYFFGTSAAGSASHLVEAAIKYDAKLDFEIVPYKGTAPALTEVMGGHISAMVDALPSTLPHVKTGKLRALAVTSAKRSPALPDVPTVAESGIDGFEMVSWYGLWAPANMPPALVSQIHKEVGKALKSDEIAKTLGSQGFITSGSSPDQFKVYIKDEYSKYSRLIKAANIKIE